DVDRDPAGGADRVDVEWHATGVRDLTDPLDRLDRADLTVGGHDRDQHRLGADRAGHRFGVDAAVGVDPQVGDGPAALLEVAARVDHRDVLDRRRDHVTAGGALGQALDGQVVRLG